MAKATDKPKGMQQEQKVFIPEKTEKDKILEALQKKKYSFAMDGNIPIFSITDRKDYEAINTYIAHKFSVGFKTADASIFKDKEEDIENDQRAASPKKRGRKPHK